MFFKEFIKNSIIISLFILFCCYINEKLGFAVSEFNFSSNEFLNPYTYAAILILSLLLTLFTAKSGSTKSVLVIFGFIIVGFLSFDFYYKTDHIETTDTDEYVTSKRHTLDTVNETSEDTLHISMKTIYLIASGGTIDATCDNGYSIIIESQDNQNSGTWRRIRYTFSTRSEYMDALEYIKAKGSR